MKIAGYKKDSLVDGKGLRFVIFMTGCIHNCPGCHNFEMQDINFGQEVSDEEIISEIMEVKDFITGITLSGGDPLYQMENAKNFLKKFRAIEEFNKLDVWLYTGYKYQEVSNDIKELCDVIIDGKYIKDLPKGKYCGSNNQKVINCKGGLNDGR